MTDFSSPVIFVWIPVLNALIRMHVKLPWILHFVQNGYISWFLYQIPRYAITEETPQQQFEGNHCVFQQNSLKATMFSSKNEHEKN
jgi:hypothetical protein